MPALNWLCVGDPDKPVLMLIHGFMGSQHDWQAILPGLSRHFYCLCPDLPGHGQQASQVLDFAEIAPTLMVDLNQFGVEQVHLLGYSMGGRIALSLLDYAPDRIDKLILESAFPGFRHEAEREQRRQQDLKQAAEIVADFNGFLTRWYQLPLWGDLAQSAGFAELFAHRRQNNPEALAASLIQAGAAEQANYWPMLAQRNAKTLFMTGRQDTKYQLIARELQTLNARIETISLDTGHNLHAQSPVVWLETVLHFLL